MFRVQTVQVDDVKSFFGLFWETDLHRRRRTIAALSCAKERITGGHPRALRAGTRVLDKKKAKLNELVRSWNITCLTILQGFAP